MSGKALSRAAVGRTAVRIGEGSHDGAAKAPKAANRVRPFRLTRPEPTEAQVQASIRALVACHPRVKWHTRINSGMAWFKGPNGSERPVKFHDMPGMSDIIGQLKDGRFLAIEVKRPSWKGPSDDREHRQAEFLDMVREAGGVAFFARRVDDVISHLGGVAA